MSRRRPTGRDRVPLFGSSARPGSFLADGVAAYLSAASAASMMPSSDKMSLAMRIKINSRPANTAFNGVISKANYGVSSSYGIRLGFDTFGDVLSASMSTTTTETYGNASESRCGRYSYPIGSWVLLVWTYDSAATGTAKSTLYINSNPLDKTGYRGTHPADIITSTAALEIGAYMTSGTRAGFGDFEIGDVYLYDRVLSEANQRSIISGSAPSDYVIHFPLLRGTDDDGAGGLTATLGGGGTLSGSVPSAYTSIKRIHCIGDSLTRGQEPDFTGTYRGGYRRLLAEYLASRGIAMRGVGTQPTNEGWVNDHDGHNGDKVADILDSCTDSASLTPDIVIPMAITNDCRSGATSLDTAFGNLATMLSNIFTGQNPKVFLPRPPPFLFAETPKGQEFILGGSSYIINTLAPAAAVTYSGKVCGVDIDWRQADISSDDVHLSLAGYQKMADALGAAIVADSSQGTAPAVTHRAALRAACTLQGLWSGRKYPTITSGKISSLMDVYADESGTGGHHATQSTAAARPLATGAGAMFLAGQDDATTDALIISGVVTTGAYTVGQLVRFLYDPVVDISDAMTLYAFDHTGTKTTLAYVRSLDGGATYRLYIYSAGDASTNGVSVPWTHTTATVRKILIAWDGVSKTSPSSYYVEIDDVPQTVSSYATASAVYDSGSIGALIYGGARYFALGGVVRELAVASGSDASTRTAIKTYLETAMPDGF